MSLSIRCYRTLKYGPIIALLVALSSPGRSQAQRALHNSIADVPRTRATPELSIAFSIEDSAQGQRSSPGWARFTGGFIGASAVIAGLTVLSHYDHSVPGPAKFAGYTLGTAAGTAIATRLWERPRLGILGGATVGALPFLLATILGNDSDTKTVADVAAVTSWISAPLGAALGQRWGK